MLSSPFVTLLCLALGLGAGVIVLKSLLPDTGRQRAWSLAVAVVAFAALAASAPAMLRDRVVGLDQQRKASAGTIERTARERCALDFSRPDLIPALAFVRAQVPEDGRFLLEPVTSLPCITLNLLPRVPVHERRFDPRRDWVVYDQARGSIVSRAQRDLALPDAERRYVTAPGLSVVVARPEAPPAR